MVEGYHHHKTPEEVTDRLTRPTDYQLGLLKDYALGLCPKEMAKKRSISYYTVKTTLCNINARLQTNSSLQTLVKCFDLGLLSLEELAGKYDLSGINTLSELQRVVLHEKAFSGNSDRVVAQSLNTTYYSIKDNLKYIRNKLGETNPGQRITTASAVIIYRAYLQRTEIPI